MKNKFLKKTFSLFAIAILFQVGAVILILFRSSAIKNTSEKSGRTASFKCEMRDPYNPFKGRYVRLTLSESTKDFSELDSQSLEVKEIGRGTPVVFCLLKKNSDGLCTISGLRANEPDASMLFVRARLIYANSRVSLEFPFSEYYMQENYARKVDSLGSSFYELNPQIEVYIDPHGNCIQKDLKIRGGMRIEDYIKSILQR